MTDRVLSKSRIILLISTILVLAAACVDDPGTTTTKKDGGAAGAAGATSSGTGGKGNTGGGAGSGVGGNATAGSAGDVTAGNGGSGGAAGADMADADTTDTGVDMGAPIVCPVGMDGTGKGLKGEYFVGQDLTNLKVTRYDPSVNFNWGARAPEVGVPADHFSIRWTGQVQPRYTGSYTFITNSDDGVRVTVNNMVVIDDFTDHGAKIDNGTPIDLMAGQKYDIKVEYYENAADALIQLSWQSDCQTQEVIPASQLYYAAPVCGAPMTGTGTGLKGEYFDNQDLTNLLATHAAEPVSFSWGDGVVPDPAIAPGTYSVRWTGQVQAKLSESVTFFTTSDDGVRLLIDDALIIDDWNDHGALEDEGTINLVAGQKYNVRLEFYNNGGGAQIKLQWASGCMDKQDIPAAQLYPTYTGLVCAAPVDSAGTGLQGQYFNAPDFTDLKVTRAAEAVNTDYGQNAPDPSVGADLFSIRWTGQVLAPFSGPTTFHTISDDAVRLWIGGVLVVDDWIDHGPTEDLATVNLTAGQRYDVRIDYRENMGGAVMRFLWSGPCQPGEPVPAKYLFPDGYTGIDAGSAIDSGAPAADAGAPVDASVE
jgi:hypothetical protein